MKQETKQKERNMPTNKREIKM